MTVRDLIQRLGTTRDYSVYIKDHSNQLLGWVEVREWDELRFQDFVVCAQEYMEMPVACILPFGDNLYVEVDVNVI